jgi:glycosyltransferase involved in cell wall biosynthesis
MGNLEPTPVSIVIPTYNREHLIPVALRSAIGQCLTTDEVIVVDDGSTDATQEAVAQFGDRVAYIKVENGGAGKARNIGVQLAKNPLVAFLDSDDEWMPQKLALQRELMSVRPDIVFSYSDIAVRYHWGAEIRHFLRHRYKHREIGYRMLGAGVPFSALSALPETVPDFLVHIGNLYHAEMENSHVATSTMMVRRERAGEGLLFAEDLPTFEDWECFGRLAKVGTAAFLDVETAWLHQHQAPQLTKTDKFAATSSRLILLFRVWGQDVTYLSQYRAEFKKVVNEQRMIRIRKFLELGLSHKAKSEISKVEDAPVLYRALASLPPVLLRAMIVGRKMVS